LTIDNRYWLYSWTDVNPSGWEIFTKRIESFDRLYVKRRNLGILIALKTTFDCNWGMVKCSIYYLTNKIQDIAELEQIEQQLTVKWETLLLTDALDYARKLDKLQLTKIEHRTSEYLCSQHNN
jgi:hypothetical protein